MFDSCLNLAKHLGMEVGGGGVEDQADWDFVCNKGCDIAQGYLFKPCPPPTCPHGYILATDLSSLGRHIDQAPSHHGTYSTCLQPRLPDIDCHHIGSDAALVKRVTER